MREVISLNGEHLDLRVEPLHQRYQDYFADAKVFKVGQAGCQIANSCWEVSLTLRQILKP